MKKLFFTLFGLILLFRTLLIRGLGSSRLHLLLPRNVRVNLLINCWRDAVDLLHWVVRRAVCNFILGQFSLLARRAAHRGKHAHQARRRRKIRIFRRLLIWICYTVTFTCFRWRHASPSLKIWAVKAAFFESRFRRLVRNPTRCELQLVLCPYGGNRGYTDDEDFGGVAAR